MQSGTGRHASEDVLEQYSLGSLDTETSREFEEHLLVCADCQDNLAFMDAYRTSMRSVARELRQPAGAPARVKVRAYVQKWSRLFELPKPAWVLGLAALAVLVAAGSRWPSMHPSVGQPALVVLKSNRGAESPLNSSTPAVKPFTLLLDLTDLPPLPQYKLEIVDAAGRAVFGSSVTPKDHKLRATIAKGLPGGMYYVRVYGRELLREYGLQARD